MKKLLVALKSHLKKLSVILMSALMCFSLFAFVGCDDKREQEQFDLSACEIGDAIPVYPDCEFDYVVNDDITVHVQSIRATLIAKNEIHDGDVLHEKFYPYEIKLQFNGSTSPANAGKIILICVSLQTYTTSISSTVAADGKMFGEVETSVKYTPSISFDRIELSDF